MSRRSKLLTLMSGASTFASGFLPSDIAGLGSWYKNDAGIWSRSSAQFVRANSEYLTGASTASISPSSGQAWTVGGWMWIDSTGTDLLIAKRGATAVEYQVYVTPAGVVYTTFYNGSGYPGVNTSYLGTGAWHFVIGSWDSSSGGTAGIQVDNGTLATLTATGTPSTGTNPIGLGADRSVPANFLAGRMQNWFMFKRWLTTTERTFLWNSGAGRRYEELDATFKTDLGAWWPLDEKSGSRRDVSGNGNTLTDNNTVTENDGKVVNPIANGLRVYQWDDAGPKALHVSQATLSKRPTYQTASIGGQPAILFTLANLERLDGVSTALAALPIGATDGDAWGVVHSNSVAASARLWAAWDQAGTNRYLLADVGGSGQLYDHGNSANARAVGGGVITAAPVLIEAYRSGTAQEIRQNNTTLNAVVAGSNLTAGSAVWYIGGDGANQNFNGKIPELAFYTAGLSAGNRTSLRSYFNTKYSLGF